MSILDFLKKIKLPKFEDDFTQCQSEEAIEEASVYGGRRVSYGPRIKTEAGPVQEDPWNERSRMVERHHDQSDPTSLMHLDVWE